MCARLLPKPMPGSTRDRAGRRPRPPRRARRSRRARRPPRAPRPRSATSRCIVAGSPRRWPRTRPAPRRAATSASAGIAAEAGDVVHDRRARVERRLRDRGLPGVDGEPRAEALGERLDRRPRCARISSATGTGAAPGRVDSPPTSSTCGAVARAAPRPARRSASRSSGAASRRKRPPSENESGVTFRTPTIVTRSGGKIVAAGMALPRDRLGIRELVSAEALRRRRAPPRGGLARRRRRGAAAGSGGSGWPAIRSFRSAPSSVSRSSSASAMRSSAARWSASAALRLVVAVAQDPGDLLVDLLRLLLAVVLAADEVAPEEHVGGVVAVRDGPDAVAHAVAADHLVGELASPAGGRSRRRSRSGRRRAPPRRARPWRGGSSPASGRASGCSGPRRAASASRRAPCRAG